MKGSWQIGMGMVTMQICEPSAEVLKWATNKTVEAKDKRAEKYGDKIENAVKFYQPSLKQVFGKNYRQVIREQGRKIKQLQRIIGKLNEVAFA